MRLILGAIVGAIVAFLVAVRMCLDLIGDDVVTGLFLLAIAPIIGAVIGALCFYRIRWDRKSVILTTRCAAIGALLFGMVNLFFQIDEAFRTPLTDFTNSLARFLSGAIIGGTVGICVGRVLFRRADVVAVQTIGQGMYQSDDQVWPPPPTDCIR